MKSVKAFILLAGLSSVALGGPVGPPGGAPILNQGFPQINAQFNVSSGTLSSQVSLPFLVPGLCTTTNAQGKLTNIPCGTGSGGSSSLAVNQNGVLVTSPTVALNVLRPIIITATGGGLTAQFALDASSVTLQGQNVLRLSNTLIPGTTVYIASGTLNNLIAYAASFPNGLSSSGAILGTAQLQINGVSTLYGPVISANYGYTMPDGSVLLSTSDYIWNNRARQIGSSLNIDSGTFNTQISLPFLTPGRCASTDSTGKAISIACGNGSSTLAISTGGVIVSSPTPQVDFNGTQFLAAISGTTTQISLNPSSVTLQGNSISIAGLQAQANSIASDTGTIQAQVNQIAFDTGTIITLSASTTSLQTQINGKGVGTITGIIAGTGLTGGGLSGTVTLNATGGGGVGGAFASWYLVDSSSGKWQVIVDLAGHLTTASVSSIPSGALAPHTLVTQDKSFNLWTIGIDTGGHLTTASAGTTAQSITDLLMNDSTSVTWLITIDTSGHLVTS